MIDKNSGHLPETGLNILAMPFGPICNLDCAYCYYLEKEDLYPETKKWAMSERTLDAYIRQYIEAQPPGVSEIVFGWQGGEPTLLPLDFYERVVKLQRRHCPENSRCINTLQTNGLRLDDRWCDFLKQNEFLVGLSLDGPADLHDAYRVDKQGRTTHHHVMNALGHLQRSGVPYNVLTVVHALNGDHPVRVYEFLKNAGVEFIQFIPLVEPVRTSPVVSATLPVFRCPSKLDRIVSDRSVGPDQFGRFLIHVFEQWRQGDVGRIFVQIFDQALAAWCGIEPSLCIFRKTCGRALALEHNGDLYACDHFVNQDHFLGNIHEQSVRELAHSPKQIDFGRAKASMLPRVCRACDVLFVCNGECPKNRLLMSPGGEPGLNYLCEGYKAFFRHVRPWMEEKSREIMAEVRPQTRPSMRLVNAEIHRTLPRHHRIRRNDPCPCGSGRKFKACCGIGR